jgi:uncharacterized delta-60 repeat protein
MAFQADGKIVTVGDISRPDASAHDFSVARFLADGQPDGAFGGSLTDPGRVVFGNNGSDETAGGVAIQPDGKIVVAGHSITGSTADFMVTRFNADGTPDASFGFGGSNVIDFMGGTDYGLEVALAPDGKIVVGGGLQWLTVLVRRGAPTRTGPSTTPSTAMARCSGAASLSHTAQAVVVQSNRKVVVGGTIGTDFGVVRFNENGSLTTGFGSSGPVCSRDGLFDMGGTDQLHALALTVAAEFSPPVRARCGNAD